MRHVGHYFDSRELHASFFRPLFFPSCVPTVCVTVSDAGLLGAALVYVLQLGGLFQWAVRQSAEVRFPRLVYVRKRKTPPVEVFMWYIFF